MINVKHLSGDNCKSSQAITFIQPKKVYRTNPHQVYSTGEYFFCKHFDQGIARKHAGNMLSLQIITF